METRMMLGRLVNQGYLGEDDAATSVRVDPPAAYRPTSLYATADLEEPGFTLGMAMATSGAAASPNMGPSTRPALAFVMTLFNVRIGRWCSNPAGRRWLRASPRFGLLCLLQELFGLSNENRDYVYISDGGHFDNLGIYELVRRRCSVIWVVDATADLERGFADLGRSIRQCRIDFGVEITLSLDELKAKRANRSPNAAYAEGTVDYGPGSSRGKIIYIKPTLCAAGDEPVDVLAFATRNPTFPHQSTADQFYSESQFESYRRLGLHIAGKCLSLHQATLPIAIPSGEVIPPEPVPLRTPHPVWQWFVGALLLSLVFVVGLGGYRHAQMPCVPSGSGLDSLQIALATQRAAVLNQYADRAEKLIRRAEERNPACLAHANPDSGTGWVAAIFKTLRLEPPSVPQIWLWLDNLFVAVYVVTLILGFQSVRSWAPSSLRRRWSGLALLLTLTLPVVAGIADYVENFLLLDGLTRIQDIAKIVPNIALASVTKFIFFYTSIGILLLSAAASWIARRLSNE
jgi:hypothetical protein